MSIHLALFDHQFLAQLAKQCATLIALVDPFLLIPLFLKVTRGQSKRERAVFTRSVALMVGACLTGAAIAGPAIFAYFELSLSALQIAVLRQNLVKAPLKIQNLLGLDFDVRGLALRPARGLVNHNARIGKSAAMPRARWKPCKKVKQRTYRLKILLWSPLKS